LTNLDIKFFDNKGKRMNFARAMLCSSMSQNNAVRIAANIGIETDMQGRMTVGAAAAA
jgi:hypothetical protein